MDAVTPGMDVLLAAEAGRDAPPGTRKTIASKTPRKNLIFVPPSKFPPRGCLESPYEPSQTLPLRA